MWKLANIIPIPKPNKDTNMGTSYRPISLSKAYSSFRNHKSIQRQVKTGVPQGGVLSPTLFNIHKADIPQLHPHILA